MLLNPSTDKFIVSFTQDFFPIEKTKKYDEYLFHMNGPIKDIEQLLIESIQEINIPGVNTQNLSIEGLPNNPNNNGNEFTTNIQMPGTAPLAQVYETNSITITFRNTLINWMYIYEYFRGYYARKRTTKLFTIIITVLDGSEIPMLNFIFTDCFISGIPGLIFSFNSPFRENKTFDTTFTFNEFDPQFNIPEFKKINVTL